jgi:prepilin-type N-terminal cleavage/methylation domain-containing protein
MKSAKAFSLIELLIVMAIIAVVAGILFPVIAASKREAKRTSCASNMRQIFLATDLYCQDTGGWESPPDYLYQVEPYIKNAHIFTCPSEDSITPGTSGTYPARIIDVNGGPQSPFRISYAYLRNFEPAETANYWRKILEGGSRVGVLSCQWHGALNGNATSPAWKWLQPRTGSIQRICFDGHLFVLPKRKDETGVSVFDWFYTPTNAIEFIR